MIARAAMFAALIGLAACTPAAADMNGPTSFSFAVPPVLDVEPAPEPPTPTSTPAPVPLAFVPTLTPELSIYIMRTTDPRDLIRYYWRGTGDVGLMLAIAKREAGLGKTARDGHIITFEACAADNLGSSAAGLFQTMGFHRHLAETMAVPDGEPQLTWANVAGPDCWDDVRLAFQLYDGGRGLSNWRPLPTPIAGED